MKKIAVKDANIFIDLESMGLLDLWLMLGYETLTSTFVANELEDGKHAQALSYILSGQITAVNLELTDFYELYEELEDSGVSSTDVSVLYLAQQHEAILLTGDKTLRVQAGVECVECHGSLWIMQQLVDRGYLQPLVAAEKLKALLLLTGEERRFLPKAICEEMISSWTK